MKSVAGKVLIAFPDLPDTNFFRTVVFVMEHTEDGAMGVILNRPMNLDLRQLWENLDSEIEVTRSEPVYLGGPVEGPLIALHDQSGFADEEAIEGVYMTMSNPRLNQIVVNEDACLKVFSGYSGWGPRQLDNEINSGGWLVSHIDARDVFNDHEEFWKDFCERYGQRNVFDSILPASPKIDPNLN